MQFFKNTDFELGKLMFSPDPSFGNFLFCDIIFFPLRIFIYSLFLGLKFLFFNSRLSYVFKRLSLWKLFSHICEQNKAPYEPWEEWYKLFSACFKTEMEALVIVLLAQQAALHGRWKETCIYKKWLQMRSQQVLRAFDSAPGREMKPLLLPASSWLSIITGTWERRLMRELATGRLLAPANNLLFSWPSLDLCRAALALMRCQDVGGTHLPALTYLSCLWRTAGSLGYVSPPYSIKSRIL